MPATDFSALGPGGASSAQGADIGALSSVSTPSTGVGGTLGAATPAVSSAGGVTGAQAGADIGTQDILSQAAPDLLEANTQQAAVPQNALLQGDMTSGAGDPGSFLGAPNMQTGYSGMDFSQPPGAGASALQPGGDVAPTMTQPAEQGNFVTGQGATGAPATAPAPAAAPAAAAPSAAPAGAGAAANGGGGAFGGSGWGWKAAGLGLAAAPLALTLAKGTSSIPQQATDAAVASPQQGAIAAQQQQIAAQQQANSAQAAAASQPFVNSVIANSPTLTQAAQLNQQQQNLTNQWRQVLFNQGVQRPEADSRWPQIQQQIQQQMQIQTQTMIQSNLQAALGFQGSANTSLGQSSGSLSAASGATSAASQNLLAIANLQVQQDTAYTNAISGATSALGKVAALGAATGKAA